MPLNDTTNLIMKHETDRLLLETLDAGNMSDDYFNWLEEPKVLKYLEIRHTEQTPEKIKKFVLEMLNSSNDLMLGIFLKDENKHIGNIKLGPINWDHSRSDIGIIIGDKNSWGRGYATEAIKGVCEIASRDFNLRRVQAGAYANNIGSIKAFEKAGFAQDAILKDYWVLDGAAEDNVILRKMLNSD